MRPRLRTLYAKIFLWFCLTAFGTTVLVIAIVAVFGTQPVGRHWVAITQGLYAQAAADTYTQSGPQALERYFRGIRAASDVDGYLVRSLTDTNDVLGRPLPAEIQRVVHDYGTQRMGRVWTSAVRVQSVNGVTYIFAMQTNPFARLIDSSFAGTMGIRFLLAIVFIAVFCLLLARHITRPIRMLESAASRLAAGDLSVRARPSLGNRRDELSAMATSFDEMAERIETLVNTQQQMLADISHELRSPLTRIGVSLELLRRGEADVLPEIAADLDRLNGMIGQILELARFDLQLPAASTERVDLRTVLEDVVGRAGYEGQQRGITVLLNAPHPTFVLGNQAALESCFENIVRNALQHSSSGGNVEVTLALAEEGWASVRIDDDGSGVPDAALTEIFKPFYRVPGSSTTHTSGSGLGLSISARIAHGCGGFIAASNRSGRGLSVEVRLPLAPSALY